MSSRPRRRAASSRINVEDHENGSDLEQLVKGEDKEEHVEQVKPTRKSPSSSSRKRNRPVESDNDDDNDDNDDDDSNNMDDDMTPSYARKTAKGGYSHTQKSKSRISRANKGNTPWNKGRNRSDADRAKIAAGVRARNRARLLEKLKKLAMTEDEWHEKRKEIKYLRERVRRAKVASAKRSAANEKNMKGTDIKGEHPDETDTQRKLAAKLVETLQLLKPSEDSSAPEGTETCAKEDVLEPSTEHPTPNLFAPDIVWSPLELGFQQQFAYEQQCWMGGPGGLICCENCVASYSRYMTQTVRDMEVQRIHNVGNEVKELLEFIDDARTEMQDTVQVARRQAPPPRESMVVSNTLSQSKKTKRRALETYTTYAPTHDWNVTSTLDIGGLGPTVGV